MRRFAPLLFALTAACELVGTPPQPVPTAACEDTLSRESAVEIGHIVDGSFEPLEDGSPLRVHAGAQGGFHSDLQLRVTGPAADVEVFGGVHVEVDLSGGWTELRDTSFSPVCRGLGSPGYYAAVRVYWQGPPPYDYCGEDPCEADPDSEECEEYEECWEYADWYDDEEGPSIGWTQLTANFASFLVVVETEGGPLQAIVDGIDLGKGDQEEDEGGG